MSKSIADAVIISQVQLDAYRRLVALLRDDDYLAAQHLVDTMDVLGLVDPDDD